MKLAILDEPSGDWDAFVEAEGGNLGHAAAWGCILRDAYGLESHFLEARSDAGDLEGVLPLVRFRGLSGRLELISMPFLDYGGILARHSDAAAALRADALRLTRDLGASALELRHLVPEAEPTRDHRVDLVLDLQNDEQAQWKALRAKVRNQTRKADKEGLTIGTGSSDGLLQKFYGPFQINMRDLGSPVHSKRFFAAASEAFGDRLRFVVTELGDVAVGGLVAIAFAGAVTVPWASTLRSERRRCPNNQIYWEAIRWAIDGGASEFDFGRSPIDSGTHRFKLGWGARERALRWSRVEPHGTELDLSAPSDSPLLQRLSQLWMRLPVGVASRLGPPIRRRISS